MSNPGYLNRLSGAALACLLISGGGAATGRAGERSVQPYIDQLKQDLPPASDSSEEESFTETAKKRLKPRNDEGSYIEVLKSTLPPGEDQKTEEAQGSYLEQEKAKLEPKGETGGAIQKVLEGKSELKPRIEGEIHHLFGLKVGVTSSRTVTGVANTAADFEAVYGNQASMPELHLFYELQPFHSELFGNIGLVFDGGFFFYKGSGSFVFNLISRRTSQFFGTTSRTEFRLFAVPVSIGLSYRFNLTHFLRPYIQASPTLIGYYEGRNDDRDGFRGTSKSIAWSAGVNVLLNPIFRGASWGVYQDFGIKNYYLTLDYSRLSPLGGDVRFSNSGASAGFSYEF